MYWRYRAYWGPSLTAFFTTEAEIEGLANNALQNDWDSAGAPGGGCGPGSTGTSCYTFNITTNAQYCYFAIPSSYTSTSPPSCYHASTGYGVALVDGVTGGATISVTNVYGISLPYHVYRTTNALGPGNITLFF